ncbi:hypothetical protein GJ496_010733 [Pomphorhynchus laevis]|nr:hypothetical protein GJ496_010733 [Pomphorhynchus laevis]
MNISLYSERLFTIASEDNHNFCSHINELSDLEINLFSHRLTRIAMQLGKNKNITDISGDLQFFAKDFFNEENDLTDCDKKCLFIEDISPVEHLNIVEFELMNFQNRCRYLGSCLVNASSQSGDVSTQNTENTKHSFICNICDRLSDILSCEYLFDDVNKILYSLIINSNICLFIKCHLKHILLHSSLGIYHLLKLCLNIPSMDLISICSITSDANLCAQYETQLQELDNFTLYQFGSLDESFSSKWNARVQNGDFSNALVKEFFVNVKNLEKMLIGWNTIYNWKEKSP